MSSFRILACAALACAALSLTACTSSSVKVTVAGPPSVSPTASAAPSAAPSSAPPSAAPSAPIFTTAEAAAKHLYTAWQTGDTTAAARGASAGAVSTLFAKTWQDNTYFFGGCSGAECDYNFSTGAVKMVMTGDASSGFTVDSVEFGSAG